MSYGPFSPSHKHAAGLGGKTNGTIDAILIQWRKAGIGQFKESRRGR